MACSVSSLKFMLTPSRRAAWPATFSSQGCQGSVQHGEPSSRGTKAPRCDYSHGPQDQRLREYYGVETNRSEKAPDGQDWPPGLGHLRVTRDTAVAEGRRSNP